jgi:uncharacterized protein YhfF
MKNFDLGHPRTELRRELVESVLAGRKTTTAGLHDDEPVPAAGERFVLNGYDDEPRGVVEVVEARVVPAREIDEQFARDEGEGFETVDDWREAHERFFGCAIEPDTQIVAIRFRLVERGWRA